jgi:hypothetical protein
MRFPPIILCAVLWLISAAAFGQGAAYQVTPIVPGDAAIWYSNGALGDGGLAKGGPRFAGLGELLIQSRSTGQAPSQANGLGQGPFLATGSGQFGTHACQYAGSPQSSAGTYYLCLDPDTTVNGFTGGVLAYGQLGVAPAQPFAICINGTCYQIPFTGAGSGNVVGPSSSTVGAAACFNNTTGTLLAVCSGGSGGPIIGPTGTVPIGGAICFANTAGTASELCPNSGAVGPNEVNTSNGSGVASFTPFLSLPQGASVSTSPVADPTGGSTLATFSTIVTQATTAQGNNREFLLQCGLTSTLGSGQSNSNGDKACLFAATQGNSGSGNIWGQVDAAVRGSGSGTSYNVMGLEVDANNFGGSVGGSSASSLPANTSFGMSVTGKSDANNFTNTGAILIQSLGGTGLNQPLYARGIVYGGFYTYDEELDLGTAPTFFETFGSHTYGFDFLNGAFSGGAIRLGQTATSGIDGRNAGNTADAQLLTFNGTNLLLCQTNCSGVSSAANIVGPTIIANTSMFINGLLVPTGQGTPGLCAIWTTAGNLGNTSCGTASPDGSTIVSIGGNIVAVAGPSTFSVSASSSTTTVTPAANSEAVVSLTSNTTITVAAPAPSTDARLLKLRLIQDATGSRTVAFDSSVEFGTTITSFTASTAANATDFVGLEWDAAKTKWVFLAFALGY